MNEEITVGETFVERRLHTRHLTKSMVFIKTTERRVQCKAVNLSASGVAVKTNNLGLKVGLIVDLTFVIDLGQIKKLHRRTAAVRYVKNGITGFHMAPYRKEEIYG